MWPRLIATCVLSLGAVACSGSQSPKGTWVSENGEARLEILDGGEIFMTGPDGTFAGTWEVVKGDQLKVTFAGRGAEFGDQMCDFKIEKKALTLSGACALGGTYRAHT